MKHILTVLFISLSFVLHSQDVSQILVGEWLVSPIEANASFTQIG